MTHTDLPTLRPPLKWAGGKRWQVQHLQPLWASKAPRRFVEPFCGGLAVPIGLLPGRALLNDINPHLTNFYSWLKRGVAVDVPMENRKECYYAHRVRFNELMSTGAGRTAEAAQLFYYLNRTGYNGLCRFNQSGGFKRRVGRIPR